MFRAPVPSGCREEADELHIDPFMAIGDRLEKNAVRVAIERVPDAQQREVLRLI
jgi:hypothetical protein